MKVFGDDKSTGRQRSHTPVENQPKGPATVEESMPTFEPSELGRFVEAFCQKEGIVDAEIARSMTRVLKYEHLKKFTQDRHALSSLFKSSKTRIT